MTIDLALFLLQGEGFFFGCWFLNSAGDNQKSHITNLLITLKIISVVYILAYNRISGLPISYYLSLHRERNFLLVRYTPKTFLTDISAIPLFYSSFQWWGKVWLQVLHAIVLNTEVKYYSNDSDCQIDYLSLRKGANEQWTFVLYRIW